MTFHEKNKKIFVPVRLTSHPYEILKKYQFSVAIKATSKPI